MILTCPECKTQYAIPEGSIGDNGRKVKCSKCAHIWTQKPLKDIVDKEIIEQIEEQKKVSLENLAEEEERTNLPVPQELKKFPFMRKVATICILFFAVFLGLVSFRGSLEFDRLYNAIALNNTDGLALVDFKIEKIREENSLKFIISGDILNEAETALKVPDIHIKTLSKGGNSMGESIIPATEDLLDPEEKISIKTDISGVKGGADRLVFDIGNGWEMYFR